MATRERVTGTSPASGVRAVEPTGITLYLQLASLWRSRIATGEWRLGDRLPTVAQLAERHEAATVTVRHALRLLAAEGLVASARGRGTIVCGQPATPGASLRSAINDPNAGDFAIDVIARERGAALPDELLGPGRSAAGYVRLEKCHRLDGQPFCVMVLYIDESVYRRFPPRSERQRKINGLLLDHAPDRLDHFQTSITLAAPDAATAGRLESPYGTPAVRIVRRVLDADAVVVYAGLFWYRGDRFVLDIDMPASAMLGRPDWLAPKAAREGRPR